MKRACLLKKLFIIAMFVLTGIFQANALDAPLPKTAPVSLPKLSKAQMLEDFDYMTKLLQDFLPEAIVTKKVYGIDVFAKLKSCRDRITGQETPVEFAQIVSDALVACKGNHLFVSDMLYYLKGVRAKKNVRDVFVDDDAIDINHLYALKMEKKSESSYLSERLINLVYHDGAYYNLFDFSIDGTVYKRGMKLIALNGKDQKALLSLLQARLNKFDFKRGIFYGDIVEGDDFYLFLPDNEKEKLTFQFQDENNEIFKITLDEKSKLSVLKKGHGYLPTKKVLYLPELHILYIRIPCMEENDLPFYCDGIKKETVGKVVKGVVIDIRNNPGGSDNVWIEILNRIIAKDRTMEFHNAMKSDIRVWQAFRRIKELPAAHKEYFNSLKEEKYPFLDNIPFKILFTYIILKPDKESLQLTTPIYVISHDAYSAAGGLLAASGMNDDIISVGTRNPAPLGRSLPPIYFSLPNSKLIFSMKPTIDLTDSKTADDVLHTKVEVEVEMTAKERLDYLNRDIGKIPLEDALTKYDPYFKKVLELLNAKNQSGK